MKQTLTMQLPGMPEPWILERQEVNGDCMVRFGPRVLFCFPSSDIGLRNMAVVSLTDAGVSGVEVARVFGLSAEYVSRLRSRAKLSGSVGLVRPRGRHRKLSGSELSRVSKLANSGSSQVEIASLLNVSQPTISRVLAAIPALPERLHLPLGDNAAEKQSQASEAKDEELNPLPDPIAPIDEDQVSLPEQFRLYRNWRSFGIALNGQNRP